MKQEKILKHAVQFYSPLWMKGKAQYMEACVHGSSGFLKPDICFAAVLASWDGTPQPGCSLPGRVLAEELSAKALDLSRPVQGPRTREY